MTEKCTRLKFLIFLNLSSLKAHTNAPQLIFWGDLLLHTEVRVNFGSMWLMAAHGATKTALEYFANFPPITIRIVVALVVPDRVYPLKKPPLLPGELLHLSTINLYC